MATTYIVKKGDTLSKIASRFSTTVKRIAADNRIANVNKIYAGQRLVISGGSNTARPSFNTNNNPLALTANEELIPVGGGVRLPQSAPVTPIIDDNGATAMITDNSKPRTDFMPYILIGGGLLLLVVLLSGGRSSGTTRARRRK